MWYYATYSTEKVSDEDDYDPLVVGIICQLAECSLVPVLVQKGDFRDIAEHVVFR